MSYDLVGTSWTVSELADYLVGKDLSWATSVTLHHTASPDLSQRKNSLLVQHIKNIRHFYENELGWSRGPHLFIDDHDINGMSPLTEPGVHAKSFNADSIGVETLGNYDREDPYSGRGKVCWDNTAQCVAVLLTHMGLPANEQTIKFHRDDPRTSKSCPGNLVDKSRFINLVASYMLVPAGKDRVTNSPDSSARLHSIDWQISSILKENKDLSPDRIEELEQRLKNIRWQAKRLS